MTFPCGLCSISFLWTSDNNSSPTLPNGVRFGLNLIHPLHSHYVRPPPLTSTNTCPPHLHWLSYNPQLCVQCYIAQIPSSWLSWVSHLRCVKWVDYPCQSPDHLDQEVLPGDVLHPGHRNARILVMPDSLFTVAGLRQIYLRVCSSDLKKHCINCWWLKSVK